MDDNDRVLRDQMKYMENQRRDLEDEITRQKTAIKELRVQTDHELQDTIRRIKTEEVSVLQDSYCPLPAPVSRWNWVSLMPKYTMKMAAIFID